MEKAARAGGPKLKLQYAPIVEEMRNRVEHPFIEKDARTEWMLDYYYQREPAMYAAAADHLEFRYLWLNESNVCPGSSIVDARDCLKVIQRCRQECQSALTIINMVRLSWQRRDDPDRTQFTVFATDVDCARRIPSDVTEKLTAFFAEHQLEATIYMLKLSMVIEVLENVVDSCMSIPKLRPFLLPLAQTRAIHQLSTFREYMQGADILPLEVNSFNDFIRKKVVTRDQEFSPYMASLICSSAFMLQATMFTLYAIPDSLLPRPEQQCSVLSLDIEEFNRLFHGVAEYMVMFDLKSRLRQFLKSKIPGIENKSMEDFMDVPLAFPGKENRSFLSAGQMGSPLKVQCLNSLISCMCSAARRQLACSYCYQKQHSMCRATNIELAELNLVLDHAISVISDALAEFVHHAQSLPKEEAKAMLTELLALCDVIACSCQFRSYRLLLSSIESAFLIGATSARPLPRTFSEIKNFVTGKLMQPHPTVHMKAKIKENLEKATQHAIQFYKTEFEHTIEHFTHVMRRVESFCAVVPDRDCSALEEHVTSTIALLRDSRSTSSPPLDKEGKP